MKKNKIFFRADASKQIGYGHFVRSLALADMLKDNFDCTFFTQSPTEYQKNEVERICKLVELPSDETKFDVFLSYLSGDEIVVLDNSFYSTDYQVSIRIRGCRLVCLGGNDKHYVADLIISQGTLDSSSFSAEIYTKFCLGLNWALLRRPFLENKNKIKTESAIRRVVVCFGGTDFHNFTGKVTKILCKLPFIEKIDIIIGDVYEGSIESDCIPKVQMHKNLSAEEIVLLFDQNDLAILSSSSICIEAMACNIPVIAGYYVDNQDAFYHILEKSNYIIGIGSLLDPNMTDKLLNALIHKNEYYLVSPFSDLTTISKRYSKVFNEL